MKPLQHLPKILILFLLGTALAGRLQAATNVVTGGGDNGGSGSLREIIANSNDGDIIEFDVTGTITLTSGQIGITKSLTISGPGPDSLAISGGNNSRVFRTFAGTTNSISGLTVRDGKSGNGNSGNPGTEGNPGGGILNQGILTLSNCVVTVNQAGRGGNGNNGADGTVSSNRGKNGKLGGQGGHGGGIYNDTGAVLSVIDCKVSNNSAGNGGNGGNGGDAILGANGGDGGDGGDGGSGGGVYNLGQIVLTDCTLASNTSGDGGDRGIKGAGAGSGSNGANGQVGSVGVGGGIYNFDNSLTLNNSTLSGNAARRGGGVYNDGTGSSAVNQCTFSGNSATTPGAASAQGGAIFNTGSGSLLVVNQSTLSGNTADDSAGGISVVDGTFALTNSIVAGNIAPAPQDLNLTNTMFLPGGNNLTNGPPLLAPLADYGGPTLTVPPLPGSPAIDAGDNAATNTFATDQRGVGFPRKFGSQVDIGAAEFALDPVVTTFADDGPGSLRRTLLFATNGTPITFSTNLSGSTVVLTSGPLLLTTNLTIVGPGPTNLAISGNNASRVFETESGTTNSISGLTIRDGRSASGGSGNPGTAGQPGGGIYNLGTLTLSNCVITANRSGEGGDGNNGVDGTVGDPDGNNGKLGGAGGDGGGIYSEGPLTLMACTFVGNHSGKGGKGGNGGAGNGVLGNGGDGGDGADGGDGGAIHGLSQIVLVDCTLEANVAGDRGGGGSKGAGIASDGADGAVGQAGDGGGIYNSGTNSIHNSTLSGNIARRGAGVYNNGNRVTVNQSTFSGNNATAPAGANAQGGAIFNTGSGSILMVNQSTLSANTADDSAGGVCVIDGLFALTNSIVAGNTAAAAPDLNLTGGTFLPGGNNLTNGTPLLGPLDDYGGPTQTMLPLPASPALNGCVSGTDFTTDQRGLPRVEGPFADIGAVEFAINPVVTSLADDGPGSLRRTLLFATNGTIITFTNTLPYPTNIVLTGGPLLLTTNLTIVGPGAINLAISGNNVSRVFETDAGITNSISGLTIRDGRSADGGNGNPGDPGQPGGDGQTGEVGGGIYNRATLTLSNCVVTANSAGDGGSGGKGGDGETGLLNNPNGKRGGHGGAGGNGGGIFNLGALKLIACSVTNNFSGYAGNGARGGDGVATDGKGGNGGNGGNGGDGGAICNAGTLTLADCTLADSYAGAGGEGGNGANAYGAALNADGGNGGDGGDGGNGGAIYNSGMLELNRCTVANGSSGSRGPRGDRGLGSGLGDFGQFGNPGTGGSGGGIYNSNTATNKLNNSTLTGNIAFNNGGGIDNDGLLVLNNSTFSTNSSDNGGGIFNSGIGTLKATNSIVAGNSASSDPDIAGLFNGLNNLIGDDPQLAPLGDYGGPTQTMPPLLSSPAVDRGTNTVTSFLTTDQRGLPRLTGLSVDIGAAESTNTGAPSVITEPATELVDSSIKLNATVTPNGAVTACYFEYGTTTNYGFATVATNVAVGSPDVRTTLTGLALATVYQFRAVATNSFGTTFGSNLAFRTAGLTNVVTSANDNGPGSLRETIAASLSGDTIAFDADLSGATIVLTNGELLLSGDLTIDASMLVGGLSIDGNSNSRVFRVAKNITVVLDSLIITNGFVAGPGGGIYNDRGTLTLRHCIVSGNGTRDGSNGFNSRNGGNGFTGGNGGGIYNKGGTLTLRYCIVSLNTTGDGGRGGNGSSYPTSSYTTGYGSGGSGGTGGTGSGIYSSGPLILENSTVADNKTGTGGAGGSGGRNPNFPFEIRGNGGKGGKGGNGGGIYLTNSLTLENSTVAGNTTGYGGDGGERSGSGGDGGDGGGLYSSGSNPNTLNNVTLAGNNTGSGGSGGYGYGYGGGKGGGIYSTTSSMFLTNTIVAGNSASTSSNIFGAWTGANNLINDNPMLAPLGDYGGSTHTMPPLPGSPAIDGGANSVADFLSTDQRGVPRLSGSHVDIGAVENTYGPSAPNFTLGVKVGDSTTVNVIGRYAPSPDNDGDPVTVSAVTQGTNGTVSFTGSGITYDATAATVGPDTFTYTVTDGISTATGTVSVNVTASAGANILGLSGSVPNITVSFAGIPGSTYAVDRSTDLVTWTELTTSAGTGSDGLVNFIDTSAPAGAAYYRTRYLSTP